MMPNIIGRSTRCELINDCRKKICIEFCFNTKLKNMSFDNAITYARGWRVGQSENMKYMYPGLSSRRIMRRSR